MNCPKVNGGINKVWDSMIHLSPTTKIASSLILKDMVGCYLYVSQARSNKKMSPQQRADVANYDLANGGINIGLQLLAVKPIEHLMDKFVKSKWMPHFFKNTETNNQPKDFASKLKSVTKKESVRKGSVALLSVIICQYFIKRVVSPFLSVPAGDFTKKVGIIKPKLYEGETFEDCRKNNTCEEKKQVAVA